MTVVKIKLNGMKKENVWLEEANDNKRQQCNHKREKA